MPRLIEPTPIIDKNGKHTIVYKRPTNIDMVRSIPEISSGISSPYYDTETSEDAWAENVIPVVSQYGRLVPIKDFVKEARIQFPSIAITELTKDQSDAVIRATAPQIYLSSFSFSQNINDRKLSAKYSNEELTLKKLMDDSNPEVVEIATANYKDHKYSFVSTRLSAI